MAPLVLLGGPSAACTCAGAACGPAARANHGRCLLPQRLVAPPPASCVNLGSKNTTVLAPPQPLPLPCPAPSTPAGMSAGVIPVVLQRGGVGDIVKHGQNGFLAPTADDIAARTKEVFALEPAHLDQLRK